MRKNRSFKFAVVAIVISFIVSIVISYTSLETTVRENKRESELLLAGRIYDSFIERLTEPMTAARSMAANAVLADRLKDDKKYTDEENIKAFSDYLRLYLKEMKYGSAYIISDSTYNYYTKDGIKCVVNSDPSVDDSWYNLFIMLGKKTEINIDPGEGDSWVMSVNARITDRTGRVVGVCGISESMDYFQEAIRQYEEEYGIHVELIDRNRMIRVSAERVTIDREYVNALPVGAKDNTDFVYQRENNGYVISKFIDSIGWYLLVRCDNDNETVAADSMMLKFLALGLVMLAAVLLSAFILMKRERHLVIQSSNDSLTGLMNRNAFEQRGEEMRKTKDLSKCTIVAVDLNGLKQVNDTLGHSAGDECLRALADILKEVFAGYGECYRIGGDEFEVLINGAEVDPAVIHERLDSALSAWSGKLVQSISASIGVARGCDHPGATFRKLIEYADMQMYKDKEEYYNSGERYR